MHASRSDFEFYLCQSSGEISLVHGTSVRTGAYFLLAMIAPTFLPSKIESGESMMTYNPYQILWQFGFDQGVVWIVEGTCVNVWKSESLFLGDGRDNIMASFC